MKTNRDVLIEAGVPAEELAAIGCEHRLEEEWGGDLSSTVLRDRAFNWGRSAQGADYWSYMSLWLQGGGDNPAPSGCAALTDYEQAAHDATPYADLWSVLLDVYHQVSEGKGAERHGGGKAFKDQPMQRLIALYGEGFALGQAAKKMQEAQRMEPEAARRELLGAMAYIAGAVVYRDGEAQE